MRLGILSACSVVTLLLAFPTRATRTFDAGEFKVTAADGLSGTEEFTTSVSGAGAEERILDNGKLTLSGAARTIAILFRTVEEGASASTRSFQIDEGGQAPRRIVGTVEQGGVSETLFTAAVNSFGNFPRG